MVCDGMGGARQRQPRGRAQTACDVIEQVFQEQYAQCSRAARKAFIMRGFDIANRAVYEKATSEECWAWAPRCLRPGAAGTWPCVHAGTPARTCATGAANCPRSPATTPMVQQLVDSGKITREQAAQHPRKTSSPGRWAFRPISCRNITAASSRKSDILLLCSDGLTNMVPREELEQLLRRQVLRPAGPSGRPANENGGPDNITALLLGVETTEVQHG